MRELNCRSCGRYLGSSFGTIVAEIKCSNSKCKLINQYKFINTNISDDINYKFAKPQIKSKRNKDV